MYVDNLLLWDLCVSCVLCFLSLLRVGLWEPKLSFEFQNNGRLSTFLSLRSSLRSLVPFRIRFRALPVIVLDVLYRHTCFSFLKNISLFFQVDRLLYEYHYRKYQIIFWIIYLYHLSYSDRTTINELLIVAEHFWICLVFECKVPIKTQQDTRVSNYRKNMILIKYCSNQNNTILNFASMLGRFLWVSPREIEK